MKPLNLVLLCYLVFFTQGCAGQNSKSNGLCWLNIDYVECLKNKLPCDCEEITHTYFSITLDTAIYNKDYGVALSKFEHMEPFIYPIRKVKLNEYEMLIKEDGNSWARIKIKNDTLHLFENNTLSKFIKSHECSELNTQHYKKANVHLLNIALEARGYPKLEEIVNQDYLMCECNKWINNSNVLYVKGKPNAWIIDILNDSLEIKEIINMDRDPEEPVQNKKIQNYKWY